MDRDEILKTNKIYWDTNTDLWFGTTAIPTYGVKFVTEDDLHLFGDVSDKTKKAKMFPISFCIKARKL